MELEEKQAIAEMIAQAELSEAEHQVDTVQEPIPYVYEPMDDEYYEALELLAHLIYSEVGDEGEESMWYAGSVVINRIQHHEYPNNLYDVVYQKGQYEVTWNGGLYKETPSDIAYEVAAELLNSGSILPEDVLYQAEFTQGSGVYDKIGNTYYCYK
jgi:spore germination cell wall hydrolase CwlJ-like protein